MNDAVSRTLQSWQLPRKLGNQSVERGVEVIDGLLEGRGEGEIFDLSFLRRAKADVEQALARGYAMSKTAVLVPAGLWGLSKGLVAPDLDISLLGIGKHRYFLFHSALGLVVLRHFYCRWQEGVEHPERFGNRAARKMTGALLGSYAFGVGIHLAIDVMQPKAVIFPFFGSLVSGTLVDDRLWLLGNSLWAFKISKDVFALCLASELEAARDFVVERFSPLADHSFQTVT